MVRFCVHAGRFHTPPVALDAACPPKIARDRPPPADAAVCAADSTMLLELVLRGGMPAKAAKKATKKPKKSGNNPKAGTKKAPKKAPKKKVAITAAPGATGGIAKKKGPISTKKKVGKKAVKVKKAIGTGKKAGKK